MGFLRGFLRNLAVLIVLGGLVYVLFPETARQVLQVYGALFGPAAILILAVAALPSRRRR